MSSKAEDDTFITGVQAQNAEPDLKDKLFEPVRSDHEKLMQVVSSFGKKVDSMVNTQRKEYEEAYEFHMAGVQKELYLLREKAKEIANVSTKQAKLKQLEGDASFYKEESIRLDAEANELRKKVRKAAGYVDRVEKERDWLLNRLRAEKNSFATLSATRTEMVQTMKPDGPDDDASISAYSTDSSLTLFVPSNQVRERAHQLISSSAHQLIERSCLP